MMDKCRTCKNRVLANNCIHCDGQCKYEPTKQEQDKLIKLKG